MIAHTDKFYILSLGCSKNTVDSDSIAQVLHQHGLRGVGDPTSAELLIVNTCAAGCLSQRYGRELVRDVPGLDGVIGTRRWMDIFDLVKRLRKRKHPKPLYHLPTDSTVVGLDERGVRRASIEGASAYLKIADGCRRPCAFCAIPKIKGTVVSRPVEAILAEAVQLQEMGIQELILIAQDSTDYGYDLGLKDGLAYLLEKVVAAAPDIPWIRIMYAYPGYVTPRLIETIAKHKQVLPYLDIPLQHGNREVLKRMKRPAKVEWVYDIISKLRATIADLAVRTTFIVGYPGETHEEFEELLQFVAELRFDRVGAFTYSYEAGTPSAELPDLIPEIVKQERYARLMELQQGISLAKNQALTGKTLDILVEGHGVGEDEAGNDIEGVLSLGRSYRDAPEIDGYVIVEGELPIGTIVPVRITGATTYDLFAVPELDAPQVIRPGQIISEGMIDADGD